VTDIFAYVQRAFRRRRRIFDAGMKSKAQSVISPVLTATISPSSARLVTWRRPGTFLLRAVLKSAPKLRGVLFEQPHVVERVRVDETIANRLVLQGGDCFRGPLPRCDALRPLCEAAARFGPIEQSRQILQQIRKAAPDKAKAG